MMKTSKLKISALAIALSLSAVACADDGNSGSGSKCSVSELRGDITESCSIPANSTVGLYGAVKVKSGATLTIGEGSTILADTSTLSYLIIERGAKIIAIGTPTEPIVFTSAAEVGSRSPSDWGGVVIHGKTATNNATGVDYATDSEIFTGPYGCGDAGNACVGTLGNDDNSGTFRYARIEFAGREIASGKEFNGLFLAGVGKGTTIDHIQVQRGSDDGIEIFGGAVDITHAIITNNQDDQFDVDEGWRGIAQYIVAAVPKDGDQGIEYDGIGADTNRSTNVPFSNFTILGSIGKTIEGAISVRASGTMSLYNSYLAHFWGTNGIIAVAANSITNANSGTPVAGYGTVAAGGFDLRFESNVVECVYENANFSTAKTTQDSLFCSGANQPTGCSASTLATTFPDGNTNNIFSNLACTSPKLARPAENVLWGTTSGVAEFIPATSVTATYTDPQAAPNGTDMTAPTFIGALNTGDTWANGWTAFPAN